MRKQYQNEEIDTRRAAVPEQVSVALGELVGEMRENATLVTELITGSIRSSAAARPRGLPAACTSCTVSDPGYRI